MKRIVEKVKDIVEVRPFSNLFDFTADPSQTLAGYHFTDITADLMAKWLDAVTKVKSGSGTAVALAGFRGVGKSHFLAALAAIISQPELRIRITDQHVAACADALSRRHINVAFVRRGSSGTLLEELKLALAEVIGTEFDEQSDSLNNLLVKAFEKSGENPLVLLIDTALGRDSRVSRDDGAILSEVAEIAKTLGIFVGLALDDDIAGADGANSSISSNFIIDYLDQEHLYKIVDSHIFAKKDQALPLLQEIYKEYSSVLPGFRWSEKRFTSLYPLHPATLEIAPLIRLYLQDFALLGFASEAGVRILGRPANSLIGLDEVFDAVESKLRNVLDLAGAFSAFDKLDRDVVSKTPVNLRLPAKLILKGLFMLSLDGQGSTASEIAAAMLIYDENGAGSQSVDISILLESFADILPEAVNKVSRTGAESKYCFTLAGKDDLHSILDEAARDVSMEVVTGILLRYASEKFSDLVHTDESVSLSTSCSVEWRGAMRHGEILWNPGLEVVTESHARNSIDFFDWTAYIKLGNEKTTKDSDLYGHICVGWHLGELREDDIDAIRRLHILQTNVELREQFKERVTSATHIQALAVDKIWKRVFLSDGVLVFDETEYRFVDEAQNAHTLSQLFTIMLAPVFESQFPAHPEFSQLLGVKETAKLTGQFFGGSAPNDPDIQNLAETFGLPLGLVEFRDENYVPASAESLRELTFVRTTFDGLVFDDEAVVTLAELSARMCAAPLGLSRETQHLVLAALVAQRQFEFVTFSGNRINHRSLDLQIIWDDIVGVARPFTEVYSSERLRKWAVLITGQSTIKSLDSTDDRQMIIDALSEWLVGWKESRVLEVFDTLPDENLNSSIWRIAANSRKTFGAVAECIEELIQRAFPLEQCIQSIADLFSDSEAEFEKKKNDLVSLKDFALDAAKRDEINAYLPLCETTTDQEIEMLRRELLELTGAGYFAANAATHTAINERWQEFREKYSAYYVEKHEAVMNSDVANESKEGLDETLRSDRWSSFESFSDVAWFDPHFVSGAKTVMRAVRQLGCSANVAKLLETRPFCSCSFSLARFERRQDQLARLEIIINQGLSYFSKRIIENVNELTEAIDGVSKNNNTGPSLKKWLSETKGADGLPALSSPEVLLLRSAIGIIDDRGSDAGHAKLSDNEDFSDLRPNEVRDWENELDRIEVFS